MGTSGTSGRSLVGAIAGLALCGACAAPAGALAPNCSQGQLTVTCTFVSTGAEQSLAVPGDVASVTIAATGAPGGANGLPLPGGDAGAASATVAVVPGSTLYVEVGGTGASAALLAGGAGGFNGGGAGGASGSGGGGGGGGGGSDVRTVSCGGACPGNAPSLGSRLVVAGGGGGTGGIGHTAGGRGGAAGTIGSPGTTDTTGDTGGGGGGPGTLSAGGAFGTGGTASGVGTNGDPGTVGSSGQGGAGAGQTNGAGGGGGGYYGGGGGGGGSAHTAPFDQAGAGGGGGGSSYAPGCSTAAASSGAPASVTIVYTLPAPPPAPVPPAPPPAAGPPTVTIGKPVDGAAFAQRQRILVNYRCTEGANGPGLQSCTAPVASGAALDTKDTGKRSFTVTALSQDGQRTSKTVFYRVIAPPPHTTGNAKLVVKAKKKAKLVLSGTVKAASGLISGVPLPGDCETNHICLHTKAGAVVKASSLTLAAKLGRKAYASVKRSQRRARSGTLTVSFSSGTRTVSLVYSLTGLVITKVTATHVTATSVSGTITVTYSTMVFSSCTPAGSC
jgi:hypothetical protein